VSTDLGYYVFCLPSGDVEASASFYSRLGFVATGFSVPGEARALVHGKNQMAFLGFYKRPNVNFRGPDIPKLASELRTRGFEIKSNTLK